MYLSINRFTNRKKERMSQNQKLTLALLCDLANNVII